jgi:hypothetical protein
MHGWGWGKPQKAFESQSGQIFGAGLAVCRLSTGPRKAEVEGGGDRARLAHPEALRGWVSSDRRSGAHREA